MKPPTPADIEKAVEHGRWLASAGPLGWESRMVADLAFEVRRLRVVLACEQKQVAILWEQLAEATDCLTRIASEDYRGNRPNSAILAEKTLSQIQS